MRLFACSLITALAAAAPSLPSDPRELATGAIQVPATPAARAAAFSLLERAKQNADMHMTGTPPFRITVGFTAAGEHGVISETGSQAASGVTTSNWLATQNHAPSPSAPCRQCRPAPFRCA